MTTKTEATTSAATKAEQAGAIMGDMPEALRRKPEPTKPASARVVETTKARVLPDLTHKPVETKPVKAKKGKTLDLSGTPAPRKTAKKAKAPVVEGEAVPKSRRSIVPLSYKAKYAQHNDSCGDRVAAALKAYTTMTNADGRDTLDVAKLWEVAKANGIDTKKYESLNPGQKRMNVGNKLRGLIKNEETVTIGKQRFAKAGLLPVAAEAKPARATKHEDRASA